MSCPVIGFLSAVLSCDWSASVLCCPGIGSFLQRKERFKLTTLNFKSLAALAYVLSYDRLPEYCAVQ
jgi:hypothetical protein